MVVTNTRITAFFRHSKSLDIDFIKKMGYIYKIVLIFFKTIYKNNTGIVSSFILGEVRSCQKNTWSLGLRGFLLRIIEIAAIANVYSEKRYIIIQERIRQVHLVDEGSVAALYIIIICDRMHYVLL
ncbi:hypothetical protein ACJX0J_006381, partial [Zea mays]